LEARTIIINHLILFQDWLAFLGKIMLGSLDIKPMWNGIGTRLGGRLIVLTFKLINNFFFKIK
jgi:hypothetical protein